MYITIEYFVIRAVMVFGDNVRSQMMLVMEGVRRLKRSLFPCVSLMPYIPYRCTWLRTSFGAVVREPRTSFYCEVLTARLKFCGLCVCVC